MQRDEIQKRVVDILVNTFEIEAADIELDSNLFEDFDLDSIDAIDMFVELTEVTGRRVDPEVARKLRTVREIVDLIERELAAASA